MKSNAVLFCRNLILISYLIEEYFISLASLLEWNSTTVKKNSKLTCNFSTGLSQRLHQVTIGTKEGSHHGTIKMKYFHLNGSFGMRCGTMCIPLGRAIEHKSQTSVRCDETFAPSPASPSLLAKLTALACWQGNVKIFWESWHTRFKNSLKTETRIAESSCGAYFAWDCCSKQQYFNTWPIFRMERKKWGRFSTMLYKAFSMRVSSLTHGMWLLSERSDFEGGIFTCNWGSFHLGWQEQQWARKRTKWELSLRLFPGPRQSQTGCWRWCISDQRASELSAASASSATWLLQDRFVPLIREYSDWRLCLCTQSDWGRRHKSMTLRAQRTGKDLGSTIDTVNRCCYI